MARSFGAVVTISPISVTYNRKCHLFVISDALFLKEVSIRGRID
jgi:hypothetical protein